MNCQPVQVERYGAKVWENTNMDSLRKTNCLCLSCDRMSRCATAKKLYGICKVNDMAMMITRCKKWRMK